MEGKSLKYAIVGAGNGGQSMAGDLVLRGFKVVGVYDRFDGPITDIRQRGGIKLVGPVRNGFAPISNATTNMGEAVKDADVIMVVTPAFAHEYIAEQLASVVKDGQTIILNPGYFGGTLVFQKVFKERRVRAQVTLAEALILLYATRLLGPAEVGIRAIKKVMRISALPASDTAIVVEMLQPAFPQAIPAKSIVDTGINNPNPIYHVAVALLNHPRTEGEEEENHFDYHDWMTASVQSVNALLDKERLSVARAMGVPARSFEEFEAESYGDTKKIIIEKTGQIPEGSKSVPPRYITEDVPMALVPWAQLGDACGVPTPTMHSLIHLASIIKGVDYSKEGRTLKYLGLHGMTPQQIANMVM